MRRQVGRWIPLVILTMVVFARPAHAYIDPGTGSYLLQTALGAFFGLLYVTNVYWRQVTSLIRHARAGERPSGKL
jgi:hypothetical protein